MFFSPGKLLLTSEYVVLDGALALAVPTKWGQEFLVEKIADGKSLINWTALHQGKSWLEVIIDYQDETIISSNITEPGEFIFSVLMKVKELSALHFNQNYSYSLTTNLQFPPDFGLGSSSTLMNNLAEWAEIDAFQLNEICLGGSGYDIAVAKEKSAILYQNKPERIIKKINFNPLFKKDLIFIHLNQKQNSREGIQHYRKEKKSPGLIKEFSTLTNEVLEAKTIDYFAELMVAHEQKLSRFLDLETVKEKYFFDCPVFVKSLGAWGGDFVMSSKFPDYQNYFQKKGFDTFFEYEELIS
jgi:mevalonate kinase